MVRRSSVPFGPPPGTQIHLTWNGGHTMGLARTTLHWLARWIPLMVAGVALLLWETVPAVAQGIITGSIGGTIVDQTDAVIPGAMVTAVNDSTRTTLQARTNAEGT